MDSLGKSGNRKKHDDIKHDVSKGSEAEASLAAGEKGAVHSTTYHITVSRMRVCAMLYALSGEIPGQGESPEPHYRWQNIRIYGDTLIVDGWNRHVYDLLSYGMISEEMVPKEMISKNMISEEMIPDGVIPGSRKEASGGDRRGIGLRTEKERIIMEQITNPYWSLIEENDYLTQSGVQSGKQSDTQLCVREVVCFPLDWHTSRSICNLVFLVYNCGWLLNRAIGSDFYVSGNIVDELLGSGMHIPKEELLVMLRKAEGCEIRGLDFEECQIHFPGFPENCGKHEFRIWTKLANAMNERAILQYNIRAKRNERENEKYAMRQLVTRLRLTGAEFREVRKVLYQNLSGNTARC